MFEDRMYHEAEFLNSDESLPVLSHGLRSRVLAAALEAQDRRSQGRRVLASALGLFAMLAAVAWLGPFPTEPSSAEALSAVSLFSSDVQTSAVLSHGFDGQVVGGQIVGGKNADGTVAETKGAGKKSASAASSALSAFSRGQGLMSVIGDDWKSVEDQLQSRQEHFSRFHM
jgi:hypothetical protein